MTHADHPASPPESAGMTKIVIGAAEAPLAELTPYDLALPPALRPVKLARNQDSLRSRLAQIPGEIAGETAAIHARYAEPSPRLFPVAVTFLVPKRLM
jgi:hypothetical protein